MNAPSLRSSPCWPSGSTGVFSFCFGLIMAELAHIKLLQRGVQTWNRWRRENPTARLDLSEAILGSANLSGVDLQKVNLSKCYLRKANLCGANLYQSNLRGAYLRRANLHGAILSEANLTGTCLLGVNLSEANLSLADRLAEMTTTAAKAILQIMFMCFIFSTSSHYNPKRNSTSATTAKPRFS